MKRFLKGTVIYTGIVVATLALLDLVCIALGIFPPSHDYGDPEVGWVAFTPTGKMHTDRCIEYSTGDTVSFSRNEAGIRTSVGVATLLTDSEAYKIAVTGDSQTELCAMNGETHAGVLETTLKASGVPAVVLPYGSGRYSPLQDYLVFKLKLRKYEPDVFVLNLYTGNDFYDLLRVDDRPHFVNANEKYEIARPVWFLYDDPSIKRRSRVLSALRSLAKRTGVRGLYSRLRLLRSAAAEYGGGVSSVLPYMNDLRKSVEPSVGYPEALTAQALNQQLFFYRFPDAREESLRRLGELLELARRENPNTMLVLSALPSYQLVGPEPIDSALYRVFSRLPITLEWGVELEQQLYDSAQFLAQQHGWLFVDNLRKLREYEGPDRLYNDFDYHLLPTASEIIGRQQAAVVVGHYSR